MKMFEERRRNLGQGGFTLIELLVVIAILAVLAGVAVFAVNNLTSDAEVSACKTEFDTVRSAIGAAEATADDADIWSDFIESADTKYWEVAGGAPVVKSPAPAAGMTAGSTDRNNCDAIP